MKYVLLFVLPLCQLFIWLNPIHAQQSKSSACTVQITAPSAGATVQETDQIKGTGSIPAGTYLWIFAHRQGLALWWPQGAASAVITQGKWEVFATFGQDRDKGYPFEIVATVVDKNTNDKLLQWFADANRTGRYPGMQIPPTVEACGLHTITVKRQ